MEKLNKNLINKIIVKNFIYINFFNNFIVFYLSKSNIFIIKINTIKNILYKTNKYSI